MPAAGLACPRRRFQQHSGSALCSAPRNTPHIMRAHLAACLTGHRWTGHSQHACSMGRARLEHFRPHPWPHGLDAPVRRTLGSKNGSTFCPHGLAA
eukprot:5232709-Pleurochrysis_carterae.AAC.1